VTIIERPIRPYIAVETYQPNANPFVLGAGRLGSTKLRPAGTPVVWTDWTHKVMNLTIQRGGKVVDVAHRNEVGTLSVTFRDLSLDVNTPEFIEGQQIRVMHVNGATRTPLFTGTVKEVEMHRLRLRTGKPLVSVLQLDAVDAVLAHNETTRYGAMPDSGSEGLEDRLKRLRHTARGRIGWLSEDIPGQLGRTVYESSISNHLTIACNTVGAFWYVDGGGTVRTRRRYMPHDATPVVITERKDDFGEPWPAGTLKLINYTSVRGSRVSCNALDYDNHGAQDDPDNPGTWIADDRTFKGVRLSGNIPRYGLMLRHLETNYPTDPGQSDTQYLLPPYDGDSIVIETVRWNAQEDITRIPDLDLGAYIDLPIVGDMSTAPWRWYIVGGIRHTITPRRWIVELTLIGVTRDL
jgi:hypothetical protein